MSDKRYEANIIRATAVEPANNLESTSAPGVWSIDEVVELQKKSKWPTVGNVATNVEGVFSTFVYDGNGSTGQSIVNGIDLSGEGGLVWFKQRNATRDHGLFDTVRGANKYVISNDTNAETTSSTMLTAFNSNGFTLGGGGAIVNGNNKDYVSWTFRKAPKFFDVVKITGTGGGNRAINHALGSVPGMIIGTRYDVSGENWFVYHRGVNGGSSPEDYGLQLNNTYAQADESSYWQDTAPTSTQFTVGNNLNHSGGSFIFYLFAHNNNDGGFGPDSDADIIKCDSYTGNGNATGTVVNLGFEPQWLLVRRTDSGDAWHIVDNMRGFTADGVIASNLRPNNSDAEGSATRVKPTSTGFQLVTTDNEFNANNGTYIYVAIRRGPLAAPDDADKVFAIGERGQNSPPPAYQAGFTVDMFTNRSDVTATTQWYTFDRLRGKVQTLFLDDTSSEQAYGGNAYAFDQMQGIGSSTNSDVNNYSWMWKRAPSYFDVVGFSGTGSARTVPHSLSAVPEMLWVKRRESTGAWAVYHKGLNGGTTPEDYVIELNATGGEYNNANWNDTAPTSSVFSLGTANSVNNSSGTYIAYLFATVAGVSKVGSYTGNATSDRVIDCGFSNGARFVLIKDTSQNGTNWQVFDTARGITSTKAELLRLNLNFAQQPNGSPSETHDNLIEPDSSGFKLNHTDSLQVNASGINYIFYAIA